MPWSLWSGSVCAALTLLSIWVTESGGWSTPHTGISPRERYGIYCTLGWMGPRDCLDGCGQYNFCLDSKLSPCSLCSMFSFGYFPGAWGLKTDVSEPSICSIFLDWWSKKFLHPGVWGLKADVSEPSIGSIFLDRWRKKFLHPGVWGLKDDVSEPSIGSIFLHLPRKMEPIECSETSAFKPQTPGKYPKENILEYHFYWDLIPVPSSP